MTEGFGMDLDLAKASSPKVVQPPGWYMNSVGISAFRVDRTATDEVNTSNFLGGVKGRPVGIADRALTQDLRYKLYSINSEIRIYKKAKVGEIVLKGLGKVEDFIYTPVA